MRKFICRIAIFVVCFVLLDLAIGFLCGFLRSHAKGGSTQNNYYIAEECKDDIIIFGSSRAANHYIPSIIADSLGMSCYNCGQEGDGSLLAFARLGMLTERHTPKLVIYEITPRYDYLAGDDYTNHFRYLKPYYYKEAVHNIIDNFSAPENRLMMLSSMYRNNFAILVYCVDNLMFRDNMKGYTPLYGEMKVQDKAKNGIGKKESETEKNVVDEKKFQVMNDIVSLCKQKNIPLLFVVSPNYRGMMDDKYDVARLLAQSNDIPFLDYSGMEGVTHNPIFFRDGVHMNDKGARLYTERFISEIKKYIAPAESLLNQCSLENVESLRNK